MVAPSLIPIKAGDRVKIDRRDAVMLAKFHRAGELTPIWIPDAAHEAMRDLVRARATAGRVLSKARQHLQSFLRRHDQIYRGVRAWTLAYRRWLTTVRFAHRAAGLHSRRPGRRSPARPAGPANRGAAVVARLRITSLNKDTLKRLRVPTTLFRSDEYDADIPDHGWSRQCDELVVVPVRGGHLADCKDLGAKIVEAIANFAER